MCLLRYFQIYSESFCFRLKTSTSVLSKDEGYSQCVTSSVNVTGHFRVSKAELEVEAFGLTIW